MCLAIPGQLMSILESDDPLARTGRVSFGGIIRETNLSFVPEAKIGDYLIVHVGLAISILDEEEAARTLDYLRQIGELDEAQREAKEAGEI